MFGGTGQPELCSHLFKVRWPKSNNLNMTVSLFWRVPSKSKMSALRQTSGCVVVCNFRVCSQRLFVIWSRTPSKKHAQVVVYGLKEEHLIGFFGGALNIQVTFLNWWGMNCSIHQLPNVAIAPCINNVTYLMSIPVNLLRLDWPRTQFWNAI